MKRACLILCTLLAAFAVALPGSAAELTPHGPEFVVNQHTQGFQSTPDLASLGTAGMVAVWTEESESPGGIKARLLDRTGKPVGGELWVAQNAYFPQVAGNANGLFVVVWADSHNVWGRLFLRDQPLGAPFRINPPTNVPRSIISGPDVAMDAAGNFVVVWFREESVHEQRIVARRFGPDGQPAGDPFQVNQGMITGVLFNGFPRIDLHDNGSFLATWQTTGSYLRRFDGPSQAWGPEVLLNGPSDFPVPVLYSGRYPEADGAVVWVDFLAGKVKAQPVNVAGRLAGDVVVVGSYDSSSLSPAEVTLDRSGIALVVWPGPEGITGRLFNSFLQPLNGETRISLGEFEENEPVVAASPSGGFVALWTTGEVSSDFLGTPLPPIPGRDGDALGIAGRRIAGVCSPDAETLCLGPDGRFAARVAWRKPSGEEGTGKPLALTQDTGSFWFFGPENLELMVKMINGQEVNGHFWVYSGALSDVEYTLTIRDTLAGVEKSYRNPPGQIASRADVDAFPSLDVFSSDTPVSAAAEALFLGDQGRFRVSVEFRHPFQNGALVQAKAIPLTGDTGAFWFFNASNIELMIKILDGRAANGHFWVYYGSLSDVRYTITVKDTVTGEEKTYENPRGRLVSRADTAAF